MEPQKYQSINILGFLHLSLVAEGTHTETVVLSCWLCNTFLCISYDLFAPVQHFKMETFNLFFPVRIKQSKCEFFSCLLSRSTFIATSQEKDSRKYW